MKEGLHVAIIPDGCRRWAIAGEYRCPRATSKRCDTFTDINGLVFRNLTRDTFDLFWPVDREP